MKRGPLYRTIRRDLPILQLVDDGEKPARIRFVLSLSTVSIVYDAIRRRKLFPEFYVEQLSKTFQRKVVG